MTTVTSVTPVTCDSVTHPFRGVTCHARSGRALKNETLHVEKMTKQQDVCSKKEDLLR